MNDEFAAKLLDVDHVIHSFETKDNTDYGRQIGKAHNVGDVAFKENQKIDSRCTITAFELKNPSPDDRISLRFMPHGCVMQADATYYCVPRQWAKKTGII